jgi:rubredoxin
MKRTNFDHYPQEQSQDSEFAARFEQPDEAWDAMLQDLRQLASRVVALQEQARSLGIFADDRELLECPKCGLLEDVTFTGQLITWRPPDEGQDTGLRFEELPQGCFRCPACGSMVYED